MKGHDVYFVEEEEKEEHVLKRREDNAKGGEVCVREPAFAGANGSTLPKYAQTDVVHMVASQSTVEFFPSLSLSLPPLFRGYFRRLGASRSQ